ncbi:MAG: cytochrome c oxidase subunit II [Burkholderiales bacterium]
MPRRFEDAARDACIVTFPSACALLLAAGGAYAAQSVHAPASAAAETIHALGIAMYIGAAAITLFVLVLAMRAMFGSPRPASGRLFVLGGGIAFPVVGLSVLLVASLLIGNSLTRPPASPVARIQVIAHQWWWEVRYLPPAKPGSELALLLQELCGGARVAAASASQQLQGDAPEAIVLANEIRVPVGHAVELELHTRDVIHSLWVPALGGKVDMIPGRVNRLAWQASRAGVYRGQCAEYCGGPHGLMGLIVIAEDPADYRAWLERQAGAARPPANAQLARGRKAFLQARCAECHAIRGTAARGTDGPDLTHVGSRRTLAAATLDNHVGTLAGWIADPQSVKPGNRMPSSQDLAGPELRALAAYLASLD